MERYFSETELRKHTFLIDNEDNYFSFNAIDIDILNDIPAAEVTPITYAFWEDVPYYRGRKRCSKCKNYAPSYQNGETHLSQYCPYCGAKIIDNKEGG